MSSKPFNDRQVKVGNAVIKVMSTVNTWIYRASKGKLGGKFPGGAPICLLTSTGRRSGRPRTAPLLYLRDGEDVIVVASKGGMPQHPEWYLNIQANPEVEIEIGDHKGRYLAHTADDARRASSGRNWSRCTRTTRTTKPAPTVRYRSSSAPLPDMVSADAPPGIDPTALAALRRRIQDEVDASRMPAAQLAIGFEGEVRHVESFGAARDDSRFAVFSVTKAFVAGVVWQLLAEGSLELDMPVTELVPSFAAAGEVTLAHLLTHTGGFPQAPLGPPEWDRREDRLAKFSTWKLQYPPGEHFEYHATSGHWVIAEMVESVEGHDLGRSIRERLLEPLGLPRFLLGGPGAAAADIEELTPVGTPPSAVEIEAVFGIPDLDPGEIGPDILVHFNDPGIRAVGVPAGGGISDAATIAAYYQALMHNPDDFWDPTVLCHGTAHVHCDLPDPVSGVPANRTLGLTMAGDDGQAALRGMGHTVSAQTFGHNGAAGQIAWADPASGLSFAFCTSALEANFIHEARRTAAIASRAGVLRA